MSWRWEFVSKYTQSRMIQAEDLPHWQVPAAVSCIVCDLSHFVSHLWNNIYILFLHAHKHWHMGVPTGDVRLCVAPCELGGQTHPSFSTHTYCKSKAHHSPGSCWEGGLVGSSSDCCSFPAWAVFGSGHKVFSWIWSQPHTRDWEMRWATINYTFLACPGKDVHRAQPAKTFFQLKVNSTINKREPTASSTGPRTSFFTKVLQCGFSCLSEWGQHQ